LPGLKFECSQDTCARGSMKVFVFKPLEDAISSKVDAVVLFVRWVSTASKCTDATMVQEGMRASCPRGNLVVPTSDLFITWIATTVLVCPAGVLDRRD
jgi:hypothetical protein